MLQITAKVSLALALCMPTFICACDAPKSQDKSEIDRKAIEALVAQLRSPNKDPNPKRLPDPVTFPDDFDFQAQERVEAASEKLVGLSTDAFPILIEHLNDKGYSRSVQGAVLSGRSVRTECFTIIERQVDVAGRPYKSREGSDHKEHVHRGCFSQFSDDGKAWYTAKGLQRWWKEHKHQSLREMQIEALQWAIDHEQQIGFNYEEDKEDYLYPLQRQLKELKGSNKALGKSEASVPEAPLPRRPKRNDFPPGYLDPAPLPDPLPTLPKR
jgi:hypothetical protein